MQRIQLIYILGMGRSGSTLLDLLLGTHTELFGAGEFTNFAKWLKEDDICTCQKKIRLCPVWSEVITESPKGSTAEPITPVKRGKANAARALWAALRKHPLNKYETKVALRNYNLLATLLQNSRATYIVDSSKSFTRLCFLVRSGLFSLKIIHLVRDGRGVANSKKTKKNIIKRQWNLEAKKARPVEWTTIVWALNNMACLLLCYTLFRKNSIRVHYEKLATNPNSEMQKITSFLNISTYYNNRKIPSTEHHNIAGNSSRFSQDKNIKLDERWVKELSWKEQIIFTILGGYLNLFLGYKFFPRKSKNSQ